MTDLAVTESIAPRWAARRQLVFQVLGAFFVGNALLAELIAALRDQERGDRADDLDFSRSNVPFTFDDSSGYAFKFVIAVEFTPVVYALHGVIHRYLGPAADVDSAGAW